MYWCHYIYAGSEPPAMQDPGLISGCKHSPEEMDRLTIAVFFDFPDDSASKESS